MHRAILFEQCICFVLLGTRLMIKPNDQAKARDAAFQGSAKTAEVVVIEADVLQLGCQGLRGYPSKSMTASDSMPCERASAAGGLQVLTVCEVEAMQKQFAVLTIQGIIHQRFD